MGHFGGGGSKMNSIQLEIEQWPVDRLIPFINNPRTHTPEQVAQVAASIAEFGFVNPILVGTDKVLIAGHARLLAAKRLRMSEVPVIVLGHPVGGAAAGPGHCRQPTGAQCGLG
jgi:ParB-like chromosome segregation protein Spo0J